VRSLVASPVAVRELAAMVRLYGFRPATPRSWGMIGTMVLQTLEPPPPQAPARRRRGPAFWVGVAMVVVGLLVLAQVAWELFGTNVVAHHRQRQLVEQTERDWSAHAGATARVRGIELRGAEALVRIPRFGSSYVVPVQRGVSDAVLAAGYGHFVSTSAPGAVGNFALAAHRVTHGQPLRQMPELRPGDRVVVETRDHVFTYRLDTDPNRLVVNFKATWVLDPLPHNPDGGVQPAQRPGQRLITLTTCSEIFHTDNRMVAFGHLVASRDR
jgi:sortase A